MIKISSLTKRFGKLTAIDELTLDVPDGTIFGLIGSNGSGKSTLLRMLAGVWKQDAGSISYDGAPVFENPEVKAKIA
jgi:ABC-2 type transport system ATP-binding protein